MRSHSSRRLASKPPKSHFYSLNTVALFRSAKTRRQSLGLSNQWVTMQGTLEKAQQPAGTFTRTVLDFRPPALYELCDLGNVESAQVEVM